jgi:hypothetical protein
MRGRTQDLTKLFKLALIVGLMTMIASAANAATSAANANALNEAAERARTEFTEMNKGFQYEVRERIVTDNDLRLDGEETDQTTEEGLMITSAEH